PLGQDGLHRGGPAARLVIRVEAAAPAHLCFGAKGLSCQVASAAPLPLSRAPLVAAKKLSRPGMADSMVSMIEALSSKASLSSRWLAHPTISVCISSVAAASCCQYFSMAQAPSVATAICCRPRSAAAFQAGMAPAGAWLAGEERVDIDFMMGPFSDSIRRRGCA